MRGQRFIGAVACGLVAFDCVEKATGAQPDDLFIEGAQWAWWLVAAAWVLWAVSFALPLPLDQAEGEG